ncbi:MAG: rod shape-determining protein RodA [Pseudomonadales bacterium]
MTERILKQFDFWLFASALSLAAIGAIGVYSATTHGAASGLFSRQLVWLGIGTVLCVILSLIDYHTLTDFAMPLYAVTMFGLLAVLLFGREVNGSRSWVGIGGFGGQPSEFAKIVLILALAHYLADKNENFLTTNRLFVLAGLTLCPVILVVFQGDLGTALTYFPILFGIMIVAGLRFRFLLGVAGLAAAVAPVAWFTLKDYQKQRILVTFNADLDPQGVGYQTKQSLIAIGSGGLTGKGLGNGLQSQLGYVPEIHSDFVFSLWSEEAGFLGGLVVLGLYLFILLRLMIIAERARDRAGILIVAGIASLLCFHVLINVGMTLGILPAIGIPLPLLSYDGSSTLACFMALGLALSVYHRRFVNPL